MSPFQQIKFRGIAIACVLKHWSDQTLEISYCGFIQRGLILGFFLTVLIDLLIYFIRGAHVFLKAKHCHTVLGVGWETLS